jgi:hypothetical protein
VLKKTKKKSASMPSAKTIQDLAGKALILQEELEGFARTCKANGVDASLVGEAADIVAEFSDTMKGKS